MRRDVDISGAVAGGGGESDARSLRRSMATNVLGAIPKLIYPLLLVLVVRAYGKSAFGLYTLLEATIYFALYLVTLGLDKGLLWWIPRQPLVAERRGLRSVLLAVGAATLVGTGVLLLGGRAFIDLDRIPVALRQELGWDLTLMALGLAPLAFMQMLVHASLAKRQLGAQVWVREALVSFVLMGTAWCLVHAGHGAHGLAGAFLASNLAGLAGALFLFRRHFAKSRWPREPWSLPRPLVAFAVPLWLTGLVASVMLRADLYWLALLADSATLGIYAAVLQIGKAVRSAHTSFGHMVVALASEVTADGVRGPARARLVAGFSHATRLVTTLLAPLFVFLALFAGPLLRLFGPDFGHAAPAAVVLCGCWSLEGVLGLHGHVLMGLGRSRLALVNMSITLVLESLGLLLLVPRAGLVGAAWAVGVASLVQNGLQILEARLIFGRFLYDRGCARSVVAAAGAAAVALLVCVFLGERSAWWWRGIAVAILAPASLATPASFSYAQRRFLHRRA